MSSSVLGGTTLSCTLSVRCEWSMASCCNLWFWKGCSSTGWIIIPPSIPRGRLLQSRRVSSTDLTPGFRLQARIMGAHWRRCATQGTRQFIRTQGSCNCCEHPWLSTWKLKSPRSQCQQLGVGLQGDMPVDYSDAKRWCSESCAG